MLKNVFSISEFLQPGYRGCQKNVPIEDCFFATTPYTAILFSEYYYDKRCKPKKRTINTKSQKVINTSIIVSFRFHVFVIAPIFVGILIMPHTIYADPWANANLFLSIPKNWDIKFVLLKISIKLLAAYGLALITYRSKKRLS